MVIIIIILTELFTDRLGNNMIFRALTAIFFLALSGCRVPSIAGEPIEVAVNSENQWASKCKKWDEWDKKGPPFRVYANTFYVGTCGIAAILITGKKGHILIDGGTEKGADLIAANIVALGFDLADVRILLHSHEHFDHAGGLAALQQKSGAKLLASPEAAPVLSSGKSAPSDPQYGMHDPFPGARVDGIVADGDTVQLGELSLVAIATPGHTAGALSWQWQSCDNDRCETIVYADSLSPVSAKAYRFSEHPAYVKAYKESIQKLSQLDCTLLLSPHPSASKMRERLLQNELSDPGACKKYAAAIQSRLDHRLKAEGVQN